MPVPTGLNHIALSVPPGTLSDEYRRELLRFYGNMLGWLEIEALRLPDRLTLSVGGHTYVNVRERDEAMQTTGYEHFGIVVESSDDADRLWKQLEQEPEDVGLTSLDVSEDGYRSFRFRYLLPLAVEVQYLP
jgi:hypothetical protein